MIMPPPSIFDLRSGHTLNVGMGKSTIIADLDFETYSEAGFVFNPSTGKFDAPRGAKTKGLPTVGMSAYTEHHTAEVLCMAYDLKDGFGARQWSPGQPSPIDLFIHLEQGSLIEAWNVAFEYYVWVNICMRRYRFPPLPISQLRCAAAKARAFSLPSRLGDAGKALNIQNKKLASGDRLIRTYSIPRNPTKYNSSLRNNIFENAKAFAEMQEYNLQDIKAEAELSSLIPDLSPSELEFWQIDQRINRRGVLMDIPLIQKCCDIVEIAHKTKNRRLWEITGGKVKSSGQVKEIIDFLLKNKTLANDLTDETVSDLLKNPFINPVAREVLETRQALSSAAVKKLFAMLNRVSQDGRMRDLFVYHTARTGRAGGDGVQPQNLPNNNGLYAYTCAGCHEYSLINTSRCAVCGYNAWEKQEWNNAAIASVIPVLSVGNHSYAEMRLGDPLSAISGCLRGMFISAKEHDFISSDYNSIEAIVLAALAGEEWALEVYRTHGLMYEMTAARIFGLTLDDFINYKKEHGKHHSARRIGKIASLASGYQGFIGAWKKFKADEFMSDEEIKNAANAWRNSNPNIVRFWKEIETAAHMAVRNGGVEFSYRDIRFIKRNGILFCRLPSGRYLTYHQPELAPDPNRMGKEQLSFMGWNTDPKKGAIGWCRISTYGGKLTENIVQAVARDILANAIVNLEKSGYSVVLHVHDEIVCEVREGFGSVEELERIMMILPEWARDWPIKASGGWRAKRYQK